MPGATVRIVQTLSCTRNSSTSKEVIFSDILRMIESSVLEICLRDFSFAMVDNFLSKLAPELSIKVLHFHLPDNEKIYPKQKLCGQLYFSTITKFSS